MLLPPGYMHTVLAQWHRVPCQVPARRGRLIVDRGTWQAESVRTIRLRILSEVYQLVYGV